MAVDGNRRMIFDAAVFVASQVAAFYTLRWAYETYLGTGTKKTVTGKSLAALQKLGHEKLDLDDYETTIANEVIHPDDIAVHFADIGGLEPIVSSLRESVIYPLLYPSLFASSSALLGPPKGVLLYGPPGCGKTMLAKAMAKESGATFINISASTLTSKWFGDSNKLVNGLFSLARKTQPSIVFIDEIDSFLRERASSDHEVTAMMKAEFMTLWDGLTGAHERILVLGATNRPTDIDAAFLRRLPKRFAVPMPGKEQRITILKLMLQGTTLEDDFPWDRLAAATDNLSGSDLKELCRNAAMVPVREYLRQHAGDADALGKAQVDGFALRPLCIDDFVAGEPPLD
ncbi:AAA-domain-containing protein [Cylindrobasidium torrendii FP15055 ss-10]|uniref:AAA-domain-containing protein n=1 Tax=Cylindrobasidium torrendii FP15055 ss-10 TaxID=1314674 RepID=A0A0D7B2U0_9AGAR|nr:AAA-domain-containing protein [Cylindrobasidium torrendii FP15055 ss-10]